MKPGQPLIPFRFSAQTCLEYGKTYDVFIILMQIDATLLPSLPSLRNRLIDVRLMYNFRDQLRPILYHIRARGWDLGAVNRISGARLEEQRDKCAESVEEEADDDQVYHQEYNGAATHGGGCSRGRGGG